jgi:adenylate cyclase class IV
MSKLEKEVKILNIDVDSTIKALNKLGATDKGMKDQKLYTYDLPCISTRFDEALYLLKSKNELHKNAAKKKLELVIDEFLDLEDDNTIKEIENEMNISFDKIFDLDYKELYKVLNSSKLLKKEIKTYKINPNKWIRLRKSNDKTELTVKHIYEKNNSKIQKVKEIEIGVTDLEETNRILESIGLARRNYQEKIRHSYVYKDAEIEIDIWPMLEPYMEIECDDEDLIKEIIDKLGLNDKKAVSLNTEQLYKEKNIDVLKMSELKFK